MNSYSIIQFITLVIYLIMMVVVIRFAKTKQKDLFLVFLAASAGWSLTSVLAHADFSRAQAYFWIRLVSFFSMWVIIAYSLYITSYVHGNTRQMSVLGYGFLLGIATLIILGYIPQEITSFGDSNIQAIYGPWMLVLSVGGSYFIGTAVFLLVKSYQSSRNAEHRNRITYLLIGIGLLVTFGVLYQVIPPQKFAPDQLGHLGNAIVVTTAILRYRLLDVKLVLRKGLAYSGVTGCITAVYLVVLSLLHYFLESWAHPANLGVVITLAIIMAWFFNPLRTVVQRGVDRLLYGKRYDYRETVHTFAKRMANVLELKELADAMLEPLAKAIGAKQVSMLLPDEKHFSPHFAERLIKGEPVIPIRIRQDSPIVTWLAREAEPLSREMLDISPEFKGLWETDENALDAAEIELLCPIKSRQGLTGILALSKKQRGFYSRDDIDLLMHLAREAAIVIENAQLYAEAKERANIDELTGLFNHRYFHQRIDEEIARCSRFGAVFSLLILDLDFFKSYNDIYGHLAGDDILKLISQQIKGAIRRVDIGFRYGGDEFAVLMPQTSLDNARKLAERLRKAIESQVDTKGVPVTSSIGIGSWPTDGVMKEEIIRATDAALYFAKQVGKNRTCLASEVALSQVLRMEIGAESRSTILSTIYALAATVDAKDHYTYGHSKKVSQYATEIAEAVGYSSERINAIRAAALLHDIGKIGISDDILGKTGQLSQEDWQPIHSHPDLGVAIIRHVDALKDCLAAVQYHHERIDGNGYPAGLQGNNIPLDARILAVADSYDAMTSSRPYRPTKMTPEEGIAELRRCAGKQFDSRIVDTFAELILQSEPAETRAKLALPPLAARAD